MDFLVSDGFRATIHIVGRVLFCMALVTSGLNRLMKANDLAARASAKGVPAPKAATMVSGLALLIGALLVLLGWHRFIGAGLLAIVLIPSAVFMHPFWKETDAGARVNETAHFMKEFALAGAALLIAFYAAYSWPLSLGG